MHTSPSRQPAKDDRRPGASPLETHRLQLRPPRVIVVVAPVAHLYIPSRIGASLTTASNPFRQRTEPTAPLLPPAPPWPVRRTLLFENRANAVGPFASCSQPPHRFWSGGSGDPSEAWIGLLTFSDLRR